MISPLSNRRRESGARRKLFLVTLLVAFIILLDLVSGGKLRAFTRVAFTPIWNVGHEVFLTITENGYFSTRGALEGQIRSLTIELAQYQERAAGYDALSAENAALAQMVHLAQSSPGVTAPITSSLLASPYGTFEIGAGKDDGLSSGELVLSDDGFVIGSISDLTSHTALVSELFAPGRTTPVVVGGASATLAGRGTIGAAEVPRGVPVAEGNTVIAPEYRGRAVGIVGHVASSSASAVSDVLVSLPVNLSVLRYVYIVPN